MRETDRQEFPTSEPNDRADDELDDLVADYVDRLNAGEKLSRWQIMVNHPELAEQILEPASRNQQPVAGVQIRLVYRDDAFSLYVLGAQFSKLAFVDREGEQIMGVFP